MASAEVGTAHVTVYPQTDGNFGNAVGKQMESGISSRAVAIGNVMGNVLMRGIDAAASFASETFSKAFSNAADYEQLIGGVETLFKGSADTVQSYAMEAYKTAGMSANEYMTQVTSFSASLIQSVGGDTAKAAKDADMAIRDMSDNANKMGSDMESITNAYQGFAKQNYTMLDNLKLGYGGTKSEMERLLADAEKISGVHYDISSYDDVVNAIHVMQTEMGIAGTTAEEAAHTISGSIDSMKASWDNWLTGLGSSDMDMTQLTDELVESIETALSNVLPAIERIGSSAATLFLQSLGFDDAEIEGIFSTLEGAFGTVRDAFQELWETVQPIGEEMMGHIRDNGPEFQSIVEDVAQTVADLADILGMVLPPLASLLGFVFDEVSREVSASMAVVQAVVGAVSDFLQGTVMPVVQQVLDVVAPVIEQIKEAVSNAFPTMKSIISSVMNSVKSIIQRVWGAIKGIVSGAVNAVKNAINGIKSVVGTVTSTFNAVKNAITKPIQTARNTIKGIVDAIKGFFSFSISPPHIPLPHFSISPSGWKIGDLLKGSIPSLGISWYAKGGIVDGATLIGAGERGPEAIVPLSGDAMRPFAEAIADEMGGGSVYNVYIDGARVNDGAAIREITADYLLGLKRLAAI